MDVQHLSGRLDQGPLIPTTPLQLRAHPTVPHAIHGLTVLDRVIVFQDIRCQIIGMAHDLVGIHVMEVILEVRQKESAHTHRIHQHILCALDVEEPDVDAKADEAIRAVALEGT